MSVIQRVPVACKAPFPFVDHLTILQADFLVDEARFTPVIDMLNRAPDFLMKRDEMRAFLRRNYFAINAE